MAGSLTSIEPRGCVSGSHARLSPWMRSFSARLSRVHTIAIKGLPETIRFVDIPRPDPALGLTRNGATPKIEVLFVSNTQAWTSPPGADLQFPEGRTCPRNMFCQNHGERFCTRVEGISMEEVVIALP